jgi:hypothetical protein
MNPELKGVWEHMRTLATGALAHANRHSCYADPQAPWWQELAVLQAAHAAELMLKARVAQEHPLLIFDQLPKPQPGESALLDIMDLFERGHTINGTSCRRVCGPRRGCDLSVKICSSHSVDSEISSSTLLHRQIGTLPEKQ